MSSETQADGDTYKAYMFFWIGQVQSMLGSSIVQFALIWWITVTYISPIYLSIAFFLGIGINIILGPIAGVYVDRWNRKKVILVSDSLQAIGSLAFVYLFSIRTNFDRMDFMWMIIAVMAFRSIVGAFQNPASRAIIPLMVPREKLNSMNSLQYIFVGAINIIGPALGALFYSILPIEQIILFDVITFLIALGPTILIKIPSLIRTEIVQKSFFTDLKEGLNFVLEVKGFFALILLPTALNFFGTPIMVLRPYYVNTILSGSSFDLSLVIAIRQIGSFATAIYFMKYTRDYSRKADIIIYASLLNIVGYSIEAIAPTGVMYTFIIMGIGSFIQGISVVIINTLFLNIMQTKIPIEMQGRVITIITSLAMIVMPIGTLVVGPLAEMIGIRVLFFTSIALSLLFISIIVQFTNVRLMNENVIIEPTEHILEENIPATN